MASSKKKGSVQPKSTWTLLSRIATAAKSNARTASVQALYQRQVSISTYNEIESFFREHGQMGMIDVPYFSEILRGVLDQADKLDALLATVIDRKTTELTPVEHAILYVGCYELMHRVDVPYKVVINEGIELAKDFGAEDSFKYVNGVLDKLSYKLRKAERLPG